MSQIHPMLAPLPPASPDWNHAVAKLVSKLFPTDQNRKRKNNRIKRRELEE
jgi:hypothetical protein